MVPGMCCGFPGGTGSGAEPGTAGFEWIQYESGINRARLCACQDGRFSGRALPRAADAVRSGGGRHRGRGGGAPAGARVGRQDSSRGDGETARRTAVGPGLLPFVSPSPCDRLPAALRPPRATGKAWAESESWRAARGAGRGRAVFGRWAGGGSRPACHRRIISSRRPKMRARHARIRAWIASGSQACAGVASVATRSLATESARGEGCGGMGAFAGLWGSR